jgi:RNA polymerase sigma-70 factor (ECF subfamily)
MAGSLAAAAPVQAGRSSDSARRSAEEEQWRGWIGRMAEADETALGALYDATGALVHGLVLRILGDAAAAEEVTADVYMQAWRQAERYDHGRGAASTWLLTLARSRAIDRLRRAQNRRREEPLTDQILLDRRPDPLEASASAERRSFVRAALGRLNPQQKLAIELAFFDGLSHAEVAARLGEPLGTVKTRIRLGMLKLAKVLRQLEEEG